MMRSFGDLVRGAEFPRCLEVTTQQCESEALTTAPPPRPPPAPCIRCSAKGPGTQKLLQCPS